MSIDPILSKKVWLFDFRSLVEKKDYTLLNKNIMYLTIFDWININYLI